MDNCYGTSVGARPSPSVPFSLVSFPIQLQESLLFAAWRYEQDAQGRWTKVSHNPHTGGKAMPNKPETFAGLDAATTAYEHGNYDGLVAGLFRGFGFYTCIDIDHCIDPKNGELSEMAAAILSMLPGAYWEFSPSGSGIHIWIGARELIEKYGYSAYRSKYYFNHGGLEVYVAGMTNHVVTVTGAGKGAFIEHSVGLESVLDRFMLRPIRPEHVHRTPSLPHSCDDQQLIARAMRARNGAKFCALWRGDTSNYCTVSTSGVVNDGHSEADLALCTILAFWTQRDRNRMDTLFRMSGLYRNKWERDDYRNWTLDKAIDGCRDVYESVPTTNMEDENE